MTAKDYTKKFKQLDNNPVKKAKYLKFNKPKDRAFGNGIRMCRICGQRHAHIRKYGLNICRQCFRDRAADLGFKKYGAEV